MTNSSLKVAAVVVTYNRLPLLKEVIAALQSQTRRVDEIIVINNSSTDGTLEWLQQQGGLTIITQGNVGGAGGFSTGFKAATLMGADWIWGMDDDTLPLPDCLEKMLDKLAYFESSKIGFLCSKAVWTDNAPHLMNLPEVNVYTNSNQHPFNTYDQQGVLLVDGCSFVSILVNAQAVKALGLPYKDFYIWYDDKEYTNRITRADYLGLYCSDSIALHKTPTNYRVDLYADTPKNLWKHAYGIRNELFIAKRDKGLLFFLFFAPAKLGWGLLNIFRKRKTDRWKFCQTLIRSTFQAFTFNPSIEKV